jgi:four helix bundle protein
MKNMGLSCRCDERLYPVPANIAEGFKRRGQADKMRFYNTSETSLEELKYYLILSKDLEYIANIKQLMADAETVSRMLYRLIESVNSRQ